VTPVQVGDEMGLLAGNRGQMRRRDQTAPQYLLLVFTVEQQQSREQILDVPKQGHDLAASFALTGRHPFPPLA
jgi:hypothetical protein